MMAETSAAKRLRPKTYSFAVYLIIGVLLIQLAALASVFWFRSRVVQIDLEPPPVPAAPARDALVIPSQIQPTPALRPTPKVAGGDERLTPGLPRLAAQIVQDPLQRIVTLNDEAQKFRQQGDFRLAEAALKEALKLDENNAVTLTNLAGLAEAEARKEDARLYWARVAERGVGAVQTLARERLIVLDRLLVQPAAPTPVARPVAIPTPATAPAVPVTTVAGKRLWLDDVSRVVEGGSGDRSREFSLRIKIGSAAAADPVEPGKVGVKLYFFDQAGGGRVLPSTARIKVRFEGSRQTWANGGSEVLVAEYKADTSLSSAEGRRTYHGYLLRITYKGQLQDERAEPAELLQMFPFVAPVN